MSQLFDTIIVGSGFGGSVSACRLAEAGKKVLVLERGRRWKPEDYPRELTDDWVWDVDEPHKQNGWIDFRYFGDMSVAMGAGVGGGSLIYASGFVEAKPERFDTGWPKQITYAELKPYYDVAGKMLNAQVVPDNQLPDRFQVMREAAQRIGVSERHKKVELAVTFNPDWNYALNDPFNDNKSKKWTNPHGQEQGTCIHCGNCDIGCQVRAKNTLDLNYLAVAEKHGAEIRALHLVSHIAKTVDGYRVHFHKIVDEQLVPGHLDAKKVILAAGSLGSTEILLRSRDEYGSLPNLSHRLGLGWCANGDFFTPAVHTDRVVSPTQGPTITSSIDFLDGTFQGEKLFIEDGGVPDILGNYLEAKLKSPVFRFLSLHKLHFLHKLAKVIRARDPFGHVMLWFGQGVDVSDGQMYLGRYWFTPWRRKLKMNWDYRRSEKTYNAMAALHSKLSDATGALPITPPTWTWFKNIVTPHPLGGCCMGDNINVGVVDHRCEVFNYSGLYVIDGSVVPSALGMNPSRTITALSERAVEIMVKEMSSPNLNNDAPIAPGGRGPIDSASAEIPAVHRPEIDHRTLKLMVGLIAILLPALVQLFSPEPLQSVSEAYYKGHWAQVTLIGFLFAISAFLLAYNGESRLEMVLSKVAALAALGIALFPCSCICYSEIVPRAHDVSAGIMFLILAYFCHLFSQRSRGNPRPQAKRRALIYAVSGATIFAATAFLGLDRYLDRRWTVPQHELEYYVESIALVAFGISWLIKSHVFPVLTAGDERHSIFLGVKKRH